MKKQLIEIRGDVFDVSDRLKSIDDGYFVVYDKRSARYEVHNTGQGKDTFCFVVPYKNLDSRTVDYCLKTRRQNADKIFAEADLHNAKVEAALAREVAEKAVCGVENLLRSIK